MERCRIVMPNGETNTAAVIMTTSFRVLALTDEDWENYPCVVIGSRQDGDPEDMFRVLSNEALYAIHREDFDPPYFLDMWALGKR